MPRIDPGQSNRNQVRKPKPRVTAPSADRGDPARGRQVTKAAPATITRPLQAPFTQQRDQAQEQVRSARRALPAPALAEPPVITSPTPSTRAAPSGAPLSRREVASFLQSQHEAGTAARHQIVSSIQAQLGTSRGQERVNRIGALMDEVATDPRLARTRQAIRHYTALEAQTARPQTPDELKPGPGDTHRHIGVAGLNFASVNTTALSNAGAKLGEKVAPGLRGSSPERQITKNALSDLAHLPLMAPQTAYEIAAAAKEAAGGDPTRAKNLAKGLLDGVYGHLIRGDVNGAAEYFREHPIYAVLEVRGGKAFIGRGLGATMRTGVLGDTAKAAASTARRDVSLTGEGAAVADRQHYSPDVLTKFWQVLGEKGRDTPVLANHRLRRRADFESDMAAAASRTVRQDEAREAKRAKPQGPLAEVVGLVIQGVVRPASLKADLEKEAARLDHAHATAEFSSSAQKRQNRTTADAIRTVLASPTAMARIGDVAQSGRANVRAINELEQTAIGQGALTGARADRAKLFPAAQAHHGAVYGDAPFRAARAREVAAGRALRDEHTRLSQAVTAAKTTEQAAQDRVKALAQSHRSERGKEAHHGPVAAYYVGEHRFTMRQEAIDAAKAAGVHPREIRRVALTTGEANRVGMLSQARRAAHATTLRRRAAEADLRALNKRGAEAVPHRQAYETARAQRKAAAVGGTSSLHVLDEHGQPRQLTNEEIRATPGLEDVAHLPHHTQARGAKAYYQTAFAGRKNLDSSKKRTGSAFAKGAVDASYDAVAEHRIRLRGVVNRIAEHDRIIHSIAIKGANGRMFTWDQAERIAENAADRGANLVPYRAVPGSYDKARIDAIAHGQGAGEMIDLERLVGHEFTERLKAPAPGDATARNVVLVPKQIIDQLQAQHAVSGTLGKAGNVAADVFRRVVLPFSAKWLLGNVLEAGVRLAAVGAGVNSYRIGLKLLKQLDELDHEQALRVRAALTGGLLYGNRGLTVQRLHEHFEGTSLETPAKVVGTIGHLPVVHQLGQAIKGYTDGVFTFNRFLESAAQTTALGKHAHREMTEMTGSWIKATRAQEKALQDVANGLMESKNIHDAARYIDETLGQYSRFSPGMRRFVQSYTPFLPWYVNSARWLLYTLPAKHPIKSGIYALLAQNLQADFDANHQGLPPGDLRGSIVTDGGKVYPINALLPVGAFGGLAGGGNEQLTTFVDPFFPQFKSAALAAFGLNFSGRAAKIDPRDRTGPGVSIAVRASMALNSLIEAFVPGVSVAKRIREGGETGWDNSNLIHPKTKPGTRVPGGAANRILNPLRPSPIRATGGPAQAVARPAPVSAPTPAPADDFWGSVDQSQAAEQAQSAAQEDFWSNVDGG